MIDYVREQDLLTNCTEVGGYLRGKLEELRETHTVIGDVRGMGLMQALELGRGSRKRRSRRRGRRANCSRRARRNGLLIGKGGLYGNVIRISPPMNIATERCG